MKNSVPKIILISQKRNQTLYDMDEINQKSEEMDFWDHLEELRWVILKCLLVLVPAILFGWLLVRGAVDLLRMPLAGIEDRVELVFARPMEGFLVRLQMAISAGFLMAAPPCLLFVWRFVAPGLHPQEIRAGRWVAATSIILFLAGAGFGFVLLFFTLPVLAGMGFEEVRNLWSFSAYLAFCLRFMAAFGLVFELPLIMTLLVWFDLIMVETMRQARSYAIVAAFIVAALLTPPEPLTQVMLALPLLGAYEVGLLTAGYIGSRKNKHEK